MIELGETKNEKAGSKSKIELGERSKEARSQEPKMIELGETKNEKAGSEEPKMKSEECLPLGAKGTMQMARAKTPRTTA